MPQHYDFFFFRKILENRGFLYNYLVFDFGKIILRTNHWKNYNFKIIAKNMILISNWKSYLTLSIVWPRIMHGLPVPLQQPVSSVAIGRFNLSINHKIFLDNTTSAATSNIFFMFAGILKKAAVTGGGEMPPLLVVDKCCHLNISITYTKYVIKLFFDPFRLQVVMYCGLLFRWYFLAR